jgi:hypothetical protein
LSLIGDYHVTEITGIYDTSQLHKSPLEARRAKTIERLQEQKQLIADPSHVRVVKKWGTVDGQKQLVEKQRRIHPWWRTASNGSLVFFVRLGGKPIEFDKGKSGIAVASAEKLPGLIDTLIAAVRNGELDQVLAQSVKRPPIQKKKAA